MADACLLASVLVRILFTILIFLKIAFYVVHLGYQFGTLYQFPTACLISSIISNKSSFTLTM